MNVFKFRVLVDSTDDVFRDIEILPSQTLQDLYDTILLAFEFSGGVMASFYASNDEWERGQEYNLLDMSEKGNDKNIMSKVVLNDIVEEENQKFLLVHDFMRMWCFYVELIEEKPAIKGTDYPRVVMKFGDSPDENSKEISDLSVFGSDAGFNTSDDDFAFDGDEDDMEDGDEIGDMFDELGSHSDNDDH